MAGFVVGQWLCDSGVQGTEKQGVYPGRGCADAVTGEGTMPAFKCRGPLGGGMLQIPDQG